MIKFEKEILDLYNQGNSYNIIKNKLSVSNATICKVLKKHNASRSISESVKKAIDNGRMKLSDNGRRRLSECGKEAVKRNRKFWTKPEIEFKKILNDMSIGVIFPDYIKEVLNVENDDIENDFFMYQYPIQRYVCDFVDIENKTVYRINGDFWHANPILYSHNKLCKIQENNLRQDKNSKIFLEKRGWLVCDIWESEIYWDKEYVKNKIREMREIVNPSVLHTGEDWSVTNISHHRDWSDKLKKLWFKEKKDKKDIYELRKCKICGVDFKTRIKSKQKLCSINCCEINSRKVKKRPSKEKLKEMISKMSWCEIGRKYGVSDNAVRKWARRYDIR